MQTFTLTESEVLAIFDALTAQLRREQDHVDALEALIGIGLDEPNDARLRQGIEFAQRRTDDARKLQEKFATELSELRF